MNYPYGNHEFAAAQCCYPKWWVISKLKAHLNEEPAVIAERLHKALNISLKHKLPGVMNGRLGGGGVKRLSG